MSKCSWTLCRLFLCGLVGCCLGLGAATASPRADKASSKAASQMSQEQIMAELTKLATPGPNHELLKKLVGSWKAVTKLYEGSGEPQTSEGTAEYTSILGGRFVKQEYHGTFMGQPFEGLGLTGYDNKKHKFVTLWIDDMSTGMLPHDGNYDPKSREFTYKGVMDLAGPPVRYRMVIKLVDDNTHVLSWHEMRAGKEVKTMEITYTRK